MNVSPFDLCGRQIMVTGASSGIGRATAVQLSRAGARVVLVARGTEALERVAESLDGAEHGIEAIDLATELDISSWMRDVSKRRGRFNGLVHAAGVQLTLPLRALSEDKWNAVMHLNTTVSFLLAKGFRQKQVVDNEGSIVFLSSVVSLVGQPGLSAYSASKGAINSLTRTLSLELAPEGIRVNAVAPGVVRTDMSDKLAQTIGDENMAKVRNAHPLGFGEPEDVACAVNYLLSPAARWVTGSVLVVDGGYLAA